MNNLLKRPGGKKRMAKMLLALFPPHECYVEPFCGSLGLFTAKPRGGAEVINDTDGQIVNLFRCVKYHAAEMDKELEHYIGGRKNFVEFRQQPGLTDIQRAARFLFLNCLSFGGDSSSFGVRRTNGGGTASGLLAKRELLPMLAARLDGVTIEQQDWQRCVKTYDAPGTFFFFDPPYTDCDIRSYAAWTEEQMQALADRLPSIKGRWLLTVNDNPANRKRFSAWRQRRVSRPRGVNNRAGQHKSYGELVITDQ